MQIKDLLEKLKSLDQNKQLFYGDKNNKFVLECNGRINVTIIKELPVNHTTSNSIIFKNVKSYIETIESILISLMDFTSQVDFFYMGYPCEFDNIQCLDDSYVLKVKLDLKELGYNGSTNIVSDEYHTFDELYLHRMHLNAVLFNGWFLENKYDVHKSLKHNDGTFPFNNKNYFIVCANLPTGLISYHYDVSFYDLFKIPETENVRYKYDGHTSLDVILRLKNLNVKELING